MFMPEFLDYRQRNNVLEDMTGGFTYRKRAA